MKFTSIFSALSLCALATPALGQDLVDVAVAAGLSTLAAAVTAAGLVDTLKSPGPFTVFAPTNDAFAAVGEDTLNFLLTDEGIPTLTDILLYHVLVGAAVFSDEIISGLPVMTAKPGDSVTLVLSGDDILISDATTTPAKVVIADVAGSNGVAHVIDSKFLHSWTMGRSPLRLSMC